MINRRRKLGALVQANGSFTVPARGQFRLTAQMAQTMDAGNAQRLASYLPEAFNGQATVQVIDSPYASTVVIAGVNGQTRTANDLKGEILSIIDNYGNIESASLEADLAQPDQVETASPPPRTVSTRDPIAPRGTPAAPIVPDPDPVTSEPAGSGDGSGNSGNGSMGNDLPLPLPAIAQDGKIFGIELKYLLMGGVALFFLMGKK